MTTEGERARAGIDLYWIPLGAGAGGRCVRGCGHLYEGLAAIQQHRRRADLYHSALMVDLDDHSYAIEMTPVWVTGVSDRGVVSEDTVGFPSWGRWSLFRYEVRCWRDGTIPDIDSAVEGPYRVSTGRSRARQVLELVPTFPTATWGRDELHTGDMWNSNTLTSWLLARSGHDMAAIRPPDRGRAPGWQAGLSHAGGTARQPSLDP
ncbi:hypothetical protein NGF75_01425 [Dietzia kunjamensis]|uniref:hypothetical protein n=1 Tax=Dietzia kunjamensis TaxID=322509 RepID=UPI002DBCA0C7|nr:hypothetical protein [Dietzia kunjamensis]MEB8324646.1 hypothetical protein [Dietzia kunjamensis]